MTTRNRSSSNARVISVGRKSTGLGAASTGSSSQTDNRDYCLVRLEQLDQTAPPQQQNHNSWRYTGPDGLPYRTRATFDTGFRVRLQELGGPWSQAHQ